MRNIFIFFVFSFIFIIGLTACGVSTNNQEGTNETAQSKNEQEKKTDEADIKNDAATMEEDLKTDIGIYNGQVDPHTIEIETAEGPTAFQLSDTARKDVEKLNDYDEVIYTYYQKDEQLMIYMIEEYWYHREHHRDDDHMERGRHFEEHHDEMMEHHHKNHGPHHRNE